MSGLNYRTKFYHCSYIITISCVRRQISDSLLPRDAMRKRGICCRPVSVRLSRWWIVSRRLKISTNFFLGPVSPSFRFFWSPAPIPNSKGNPFNDGVKYTGWEKSAIFYWNSRLSRKQYEIGPWLLRNVNRKSYGGGSIHVDSDDLEWHLTLVSRYTCILTSRIS